MRIRARAKHTADVNDRSARQEWGPEGGLLQRVKAATMTTA